MIPKFRIWDKVDKRIAQVILIHWDLNGEIIKSVEYKTEEKDGSDLFHVRRPEHYELMQFTGMKDKNGKDIYAGDILFFHQLALVSTLRGEIYQDTEAEIIWYEGYGLSGFTFKVIGKHHLRCLDATKGEIIRNIYDENLPEDASKKENNTMAGTPDKSHEAIV